MESKEKVLAEILSRMLRVEAGSKKGVSFSYDTSTGLCIYFRQGREVKHQWIEDAKRIYFDGSFVERSLEELLNFIAKVEALPDQEPNVYIHMTESRARELGLMENV